MSSTRALRPRGVRLLCCALGAVGSLAVLVSCGGSASSEADTASAQGSPTGGPDGGTSHGSDTTGTTDGSGTGGSGGTSTGGTNTTSEGSGGTQATGGAASGTSGVGGAATGSGDATTDAAGDTGGSDEVQCVGTDEPQFPSFDRACQEESDCVLVTHETSCCGSQLVMAISSHEKDAFAAAEAICDGQYPRCGCAAQGVDIEDGTQISWNWQDQVAARCDSGSCKAHYAGGTFPCGDSRMCTDGQYCTKTSGGPAGTEPSASCVETTCTDCACLSITDGACTCTEQDGHLTVDCLRQ